MPGSPQKCMWSDIWSVMPDKCSARSVLHCDLDVGWVSWWSIWSCCQFSCSCIWARQRQTGDITLFAYEGACSFSLLRLVSALSERSTRSFSPLSFVCQSFSAEAPCTLHALPSQTVFDFLSRRYNKLCHFISDIMNYFLAGEDQQQTNQPNDLAGN